MKMNEPKPIAPATYCGVMLGIDLWTLTDDIPGHPCGSTVSRETLEGAGYRVPMAPGDAQRAASAVIIGEDAL